MARQRSEKVDEAIVSSTLAVIADHGVEGFSVEEVAARASVGKATIYRRYADRNELISSALETLNDDLPEINKKASAVASLIDMLEWVRTSRTSGADLLPRVFAQARSNPALYEICHSRVISPRWDRIHEVLSLGIKKGELREDLDVDIATTMLVSPVLMFNMLALNQEQANPKDFVSRLVRNALGGIGPQQPAIPAQAQPSEAISGGETKPRRRRGLRKVLASDS